MVALDRPYWPDACNIGSSSPGSMHSPMRILHVLHNSVPLLCGYSIRSGYIVDLERAMGWDPSAVTSGQQPQGGPPREVIGGTEYRRTPASTGGRLPFAKEWALMRSLERQVEAVARDVRPDLIHAH